MTKPKTEEAPAPLSEAEIAETTGGSGFLPPDYDNEFRREYPDFIWL